nr:hypothetical protein [Tanacetum cinerariifolium]
MLMLRPERKKIKKDQRGRGRSKPKMKRWKTSAVRKGQTASSGGTTSPTPIWTAPPVGNTLVIYSEDEEEDAGENLLFVDESHVDGSSCPLSNPAAPHDPTVKALLSKHREILRELKDEHSDCDGKIKALEQEKDELIVANNNQANRIRELEAELEKKNFKLKIVDKESSTWVKEKQALLVRLVHPGPAPSRGLVAPTISSTLVGPPALSFKKKA